MAHRGSVLMVVLILIMLLRAVASAMKRVEPMVDWAAHDRRTFMDNLGGRVDQAAVEREEQQVVAEFLQRGDRVLELGARFGTVSAVILDTVRDAVIVEPDRSVVDTLRANLNAAGHGGARIVSAMIGTPDGRAMGLNHSGYGGRTEPCIEGEGGGACERSVSVMPYSILQKETGVVFDTIVADCEGCFPAFLHHVMHDSYPDLGPIHKLIFETDYPDKVDYPALYAILQSLGFVNKRDGFVQVWERARQNS